jgi:TatA/E family protein of Tat protein translocase
LPDPISLAVVAAVAIVVLVMGPKKIPEFAKALGSAKKDFEDAKKAVRGEY